jgi:hypothetical protein
MASSALLRVVGAIAAMLAPTQRTVGNVPSDTQAHRLAAIFCHNVDSSHVGMRTCGCGERRMRANSMPGSLIHRVAGKRRSPWHARQSAVLIFR